MQKLIEMLLENLSTRDVFLFRIACGACGTECGGSQVRFSKAGVNPQSRRRKSSMMRSMSRNSRLHGARQCAMQRSS